MTSEAPFLFSVDVEDPRLSVVGGETFAPRVPDLVGTYLQFLSARQAKATFFILGEVARRHPELVGRIASAGHEIACHSDRHIVLGEQDPVTFRDDLVRNIEALEAAGAQRPRGYRAPCFSLTERTRWAYPILAELGFTYSSSVLPARNPLHGWPGFGVRPRLVDDVLELPVSLHSRLLPLPLGGVYLRVLPMFMLRRAFRRRRRRGEPILSYVHPYDIDPDQEDFAHPGFARWSPYNRLLRANRRHMLARLEALFPPGSYFRTYLDHAGRVRRKIDFPG